jgi:hypothetical protein
LGSNLIAAKKTHALNKQKENGNGDGNKMKMVKKLQQFPF